jgi:hypothetical protein
MNAELKPGSRWKSAVCDTEVVVVRPPTSPSVLECGGAPMLDIKAQRPTNGAVAPGHAAASLLGKRYADEASGLEVLCTKAGAGSLAVDDRPMLTKEAKKLPSSD